MRNLTTTCLMTLLSVGIIACTPGQQLNRVKPKGDEFSNALFNNYKQFVKSEEKQSDWSDASYFSKKAMRAASGEYVLPENPKEWRISAEHMPELQAARTKLLEVLADKQLVHNRPLDVASAQYYFDCWVEQQEEAWQLDDIQICRSGFYNTMYKLGHGTERDIMSKYKVIETDEKFVHKIFFPFDRVTLDNKAKKFIDEFVKNYKKDGLQYKIIVNGYADRVGKKDYNLALSKKRAEAVKNAIIKSGIDKNLVTVNAYGEEENAVQTNDGEREPLNRRVEILLVE